MFSSACAWARRPVLLGVAALCSAAFAVPAAPAVAASDAGYFGICGGMVMDLPAAQRDAQLHVMQSNGLSVLRQDAPWGTAEPDAPDAVTGAHHYDWARFDATATALAAAGLRWYPILDYDAAWSRSIEGDQFSAPRPDTVGDFAAYAQAFAARYGPQGTFWAEHPELPALPVASYEIWNEPNARMFWRQQETAPEAYADLYAAAREAIRQVDTATPVVVGGLLDANATDPNLFLRRMVAHVPSLRTEMDAVGYHPYQESYDGIMEGIRTLRATMRRLGAATTPIEITEVGITTAWVSEARRSRTFSRLAMQLPHSSLGVTRFIPYTWASSDAGDGPDGYWGMVRLDGTLKPTALAYLGVTHAAQARTVRARAAARSASARRAARRASARVASVRRAQRRARASRRAAPARAARAVLPTVA